VEVSGNEDCVPRWLTGGEFFITQPVGQSPPELPTYLRQEPAYRGRAIRRIAQRKKGKRPHHSTQRKKKKTREKEENKPKQKLTKKTKKLSLNGV